MSRTPAPRRRSNPIVATLKALLRTRITSGLLIVLPVYVTILLLSFVFGIMRDSSRWAVVGYLRSDSGLELLDKWYVEAPPGYPEDAPARKVEEGAAVRREVTVANRLKYLEARLGRSANSEEFQEILPPGIQWAVAIMSVLLTIVILYAIGLFTANIFGRRIILAMENLLDRVPLVKTVYRASKQILEAFTGDGAQSFQRVALVPFPQEKMRCVGFITSIFEDTATREELATVFIPTTPNPTTGYLQIIRRSELVELDWTIEEAVRVIMSGGILRPEFLTMRPDLDKRAQLDAERGTFVNPPPPPEAPEAEEPPRD